MEICSLIVTQVSPNIQPVNIQETGAWDSDTELKIGAFKEVT